MKPKVLRTDAELFIIEQYMAQLDAVARVVTAASDAPDVLAREAADATAEITATLGRARVLGEKSVGTPDPGAISFSILMRELGQHLS